MHRSRAMRVLTGHRINCSLGRMAGCSKTQWVVICTWAACSSLNGLQYCARTSAHTSTCCQSDSLVSGVRSHVPEGHAFLSFRGRKMCHCACGVFAVDFDTATPTASLRRASGDFDYPGADTEPVAAHRLNGSPRCLLICAYDVPGR